MKQTIDYLKSRFKRGTKPTMEDFIDIFESFLHKDDVNKDFYPCMMQVEKGIKNTDTFIIPGKVEIVSIYVDNNTLLPGNISIGSSAGLSDIVATIALPQNGKPKRLNYIINYNYPDNNNRKMYVTISTDVRVKFQILTRKLYD